MLMHIIQTARRARTILYTYTFLADSIHFSLKIRYQTSWNLRGITLSPDSGNTGRVAAVIRIGSLDEINVLVLSQCWEFPVFPVEAQPVSTTPKPVRMVLAHEPGVKIVQGTEVKIRRRKDPRRSTTLLGENLTEKLLIADQSTDTSCILHGSAHREVVVVVYYLIKKHSTRRVWDFGRIRVDPALACLDRGRALKPCVEGRDLFPDVTVALDLGYEFIVGRDVAAASDWPDVRRVGFGLKTASTDEVVACSSTVCFFQRARSGDNTAGRYENVFYLHCGAVNMVYDVMCYRSYHRH